MSSAILYLAIIAIWACVLIPRWLRRDSAHQNAWAAEHPALPDEAGRTAKEREFASAAARWVPAPSAGRAGAGAAGATDDGQEPRPAARHPAAASLRRPAAEHQARIVAARRRMLMILLTLTAAAVGLAAIRLAAWWVSLPPAVMLASYLVLLREASRADAEHAQLTAYAAALAAERRRAAAARRRAEQAAARRAEQAQTALVIDIAGRMRDQLYDQYADPGVGRAVGD